MSKRCIACILLFVFCVGGRVAYGENQLPAFSRATPEPAVSDGLPAFSRPTPAVADTPAPTPRPTAAPTPTPEPTPEPNPAVILSDQGIQYEVTDVYYEALAGRLYLEFVGVLTNNSGSTVRVGVESASDADDGLYYFNMSDKDAQGETRQVFASGGVYEGVTFSIRAETAQSAQRLLSTKRFDLRIRIIDGSYKEIFTRNAQIRDAWALSQTPDTWENVLVSGAGADSMMDVNGVRVELNSVEISEYDTTTFLRLTFSGASESAACIVNFGYFRVDGIEAENGISSSGSLYMSETGAGAKATVNLMATGDDREVFRDPEWIEFLCLVEDRETRRVMFCVPVTLYAGDIRAAGNNASYSTLQKGDEGFWVEQLQRQLIVLNYLFDSADGVYGGKTASAVKEFCRNNGLPETEIADAAVQRKLFGIGAVAAYEPDFAVTFSSDVTMRHSNEKGDKLKFRIQGVRNLSPKQSIKSFEIRVYAENAYGSPIYGTGRYYYDTTTTTIAPGKSVNSVYLIIPNRSDISTLYVGISKFTYSDGLVVEADPVNYWSWDFSGYF